MVVECRKEGEKEEEGTQDRKTKQENKTFFWLMQTLYTQLTNWCFVN